MRIQDKLNKIKNSRGFTLVELMIVVAIIGVLAALAIYGVRKYLTNAKTAEARTALGRISKDTQSAWERESMPTGVLTLGESAANSRAFCGIGPAVPSAIDKIQNSKYQSSPADWKAGAWGCLKFTMDGPQYFQYVYTSSGSDSGSTFLAEAHADFNGNGALSTFSITGALDDSASGEMILKIAPAIVETAVDE